MSCILYLATTNRLLLPLRHESGCFTMFSFFLLFEPLKVVFSNNTKKFESTVCTYRYILIQSTLPAIFHTLSQTLPSVIMAYLFGGGESSMYSLLIYIDEPLESILSSSWKHLLPPKNSPPTKHCAGTKKIQSCQITAADGFTDQDLPIDTFVSVIAPLLPATLHLYLSAIPCEC
jgi:hypothetical protein